MARRTYLKNAAILTVTGLILRAAGMFLRVYVAARIGAEGMGVYQLITTVYNLAITVATAGLSVAATRVCADLAGAGKFTQARPAMRRILLLSAVMGLTAAFGLAGLSRVAAQWWLKDMRAVLPLRILAPSLPFMAMSAVLRGYFLAVRDVRPNSEAQLLEQAVRIGLVALLLGRVGSADVETACAAVVVGNTISEACSWAYMAVRYGRSGRGSTKGPSPSHLGGTLAGILVPIAANQYLTSLLRTVENVMVPGCLALFTLSRETALAQYGALKGMAMPVLFFPFSFLSTLATLLLPDITEAHVRGDTRALKRLIDRVLMITLTMSILMSGVFTMLAYPLAEVLYHDAEIGFYLSVLGPLMPFMYMESMVDGILKGLNEQLSTFRYSVVDSVVRIVLIALLAPHFGMKGFLFVMLVSNLLTSLLNLHRLLDVTGMHIHWGKWVLGPLLCFGLAGGACRLVLAPLLEQHLSTLGWGLAAGAFMTLVYFVLLLFTGTLTLEDLWLKKKKPVDNRG